MTRYDHIKFPPYVFQEYPKWVGEVIVNSADEEAALSPPDENTDTPAERIKRPYHRKDK
jgi:hypothetical protein